MSSLSVRDCIAFGWNTVKARPWIFVQAGILLFLVNMGVSLVQSGFEAGGEMGGEMVALIAGILSLIVGIIVSFLMSMGETAFFLRAHDAPEAVSLKDLWHPYPFWKFAGVSVLAGLAILIGLVLLVVPGIILGIMFMFVGYVVIEEKLSPVAAIRRSMALTKGSRWKLFQLALATLALNILGFIALLVGLLVTIPVTFLAGVHAYRTLRRVEVAEETVVVPV